jgi:hypothetical protein
MPDLEKITIKTDSDDIDFLKVETSGQSNLCGYNAISNYIKFLPLNQRLECYKKLLSKVWSRHNHGTSNPFETLTDQLKNKLLFLEEFFKLREELDFNDENQSAYQKALDLNQEFDKSCFELAKKKFFEKFFLKRILNRNKYKEIFTLDYNNFFKEFYLTGGVLRMRDDGILEVLLDNTHDQGYSYYNEQDFPIFSYQNDFLKTSYQNWVSFLMAIGYNAESYTDILNPFRIFNDLLPHNSFIILGIGATLDQEHYAIKNKYLESVYEYCEQYRQGVLGSRQFYFNQQFNLENYKKILVSAYLQILKKFESASHQLSDGSNVEPNQQQSVFKIFRHFLLKQSYDDFFDENKNDIQ